MRRALLLLLAGCLICGPAFARGKKKGADTSEPAPKKEKHDALGSIVLNGEKTEIRWTDGKVTRLSFCRDRNVFR